MSAEDSELPKGSEYDDGGSEKGFVDGYIRNWSPEDLFIAEQVADQITLEGELPSTVVIIPVAAHSEADNIVPALAEYAKQETTDKFAVHLHMNWPNTHKNSPTIQQSFDEIVKARELFPNLDLRVSVLEYSDQPKIGEIRRAAWNGTLLRLQRQGNYVGSVGMNHDIDVIKLSRSYVANVQKFYKDFYSQELRDSVPTTASTQVTHSLDPEYPNTSMAVFWADFASRMNKGNYEAGTIIPMSTYALADGFSGDATTYETSRFNSTRGPMPLIPGTVLKTSARRYLQRMHDNDYDTIWTDDSFGANEALRAKTTFTDISHDEMIRKVSEDSTYFAVNYIANVLNWHLTEREEDDLVSEDDTVRTAIETDIFRRINKTERMTRYVLDTALQVPRVGSFLSSQYFTKQYVEHMIYVKRLAIRKRQSLLSPENLKAFTTRLIEDEAAKAALADSEQE